MCIAILTKPGTVVTDAALGSCYSSNPHGIGMAYIDPSTRRVVIDKGYMTLKPFADKYKELVAAGVNKKPMLIHFRIATLGKVNADNTHPFPIPGGALIHNGILWGGSGGLLNEKSDTREFAERVGDVLRYKDLKFDTRTVESQIRSNKIALLYDNGRYIILNEEAGHWDEDIWYSNRSYINYYRGH